MLVVGSVTTSESVLLYVFDILSVLHSQLTLLRGNYYNLSSRNKLWDINLATHHKLSLQAF
jgi:hypothetical protein